MAGIARNPAAGDRRRSKMHERLATLEREKDNQEAQKKIAFLQEALQKSNDELLALTSADLEKMDIDNVGDENPEPDNVSTDGDKSNDNTAVDEAKGDEAKDGEENDEEKKSKKKIE